LPQVPAPDLPPRPLALLVARSLAREGNGVNSLCALFDVVVCSGLPASYPLVIYAELAGGRGRVPVGLRLLAPGDSAAPRREFILECDFPDPKRGVAVTHEHTMTSPRAGDYRLQLLATGWWSPSGSSRS